MIQLQDWLTHTCTNNIDSLTHDYRASSHACSRCWWVGCATLPHLYHHKTLLVHTVLPCSQVLRFFTQAYVKSVVSIVLPWHGAGPDLPMLQLVHLRDSSPTLVISGSTVTPATGIDGWGRGRAFLPSSWLVYKHHCFRILF